MNKITTIRIDEDLLDKVKAYSELNGVSQTDLINKLLSDGLDQMILERSGAALFTIPNPQLSALTSKEAEDALDFLTTTAKNFHDMRCNIPVPFYGILAYLEQRLIYDLPEERKKFKQNMVMDGTLSETLAEIMTV